MSVRRTPEKASPLHSSFLEKARGKIAVLALGAMALPGCKVTLGYNITTPEGKKAFAQERVRRIAVGKDGVRVIHSTEADAIVVMQRKEKETKSEERRSEIRALLDLSEYSPLHTRSDETQVYDLPKSAAPWLTLVAEPEGRISMRMKGDILALQFECDANLGQSQQTYCKGTEVDPAALDEAMQADAETREAARQAAEAETQKKAEEEAAKEKEEAEAKEKEEEDAARKQQEAELEAGAATGSLSDKVYIVSGAVSELIRQLEVPIAMLDWPAKQELARELASVNPEWAAFVEKQISDINASTVKKSELEYTIVHLLHFRPSMIDVVAKKLGVTLSKPQPKAKPEAEGKSYPVTDEERAKLDYAVQEADRAIETLNSPVR